jgi:hypothetical protein
MLRIGLAASKISKGNIWFYHLAVVLISLLFAVFAFLICGFAIGVTIFILSLVLQRVMPSVNAQAWMDVLRTCLIILGVLIGILSIVAIIKNTKLKS